ncbi:hypothetical protein KUTeg_005901 [Tegillarca granosa]|uniref:PiggyBac transposable element-derived protein domain-containing protein n=1 Tax=Tegillarca granosa TaxID=220873 RepID=A0ABQ9FGY1_TEGGR|nr:hypothetical protein KUTeg_005901 [Tegillarca granosa]
MKRNRFQLILKYLHCNDNSTAVRRGVNGYDPAHKIRPILDLVNQRFKECYNLARDLTVDESIVGFKGRHNIVQYLPGKKTHRWGAKLFILAESETGYTSHIKVYAGKRHTAEARHPHGMGYEVVTELVSWLYGKYHHVVTDNFFGSPVLCEDLFNNKTYFTSTVRNFRYQNENLKMVCEEDAEFARKEPDLCAISADQDFVSVNASRHTILFVVLKSR